MPKVIISDDKGLVQEPGGGFSVTNTASLASTLSATGAIKPGVGGLMLSAPAEYSQYPHPQLQESITVLFTAELLLMHIHFILN